MGTLLFGPLASYHLSTSDLLDMLLSETDPLTFIKEDLVLDILHSLKFGVGSAVLPRDQLILARCELFAHHAAEKLPLVKFFIGKHLSLSRLGHLTQLLINFVSNLVEGVNSLSLII